MQDKDHKELFLRKELKHRKYYYVLMVFMVLLNLTYSILAIETSKKKKDADKPKMPNNVLSCLDIFTNTIPIVTLPLSFLRLVKYMKKYHDEKYVS